MGRIFLLQFDQADPKLVCRTCQTHIALIREHRCILQGDDDEVRGAVFRTAINWHSLGEEPNRRAGDTVVSQIYCNNCGYPLGFQIIEILNDTVSRRVKEKHLILRRPRVLVWNGNEFVPHPEDEGPNPEPEDEGDEDEVDEDEGDEDEVDEDEVGEDEVDEDEVGEDEVDEDEGDEDEVDEDEVGEDEVDEDEGDEDEVNEDEDEDEDEVGGNDN